MTGRRLILNDGTELENGEAGYSDNTLWCYVPGISMQQAAALFFDQEKTAKIVFQYGEMQNVYEGYTDPAIIMQADNQIKIALKKPEA